MNGNLELSLDKLPVKRLNAIEENGVESFPPDIGYEEKRVSLIRRIDFAWALEDEEEKKKKKQKTSKETSVVWEWQGMVENLQLAHQELSVILDLIGTVETNDAVTVAGMTRPKLLPNELLSDLGVSTATKIESYRNLSKYFKQSGKVLEQKISREARFYGALIRLQQNWKVKRQRLPASLPSNAGFTIDLFDNSLYNSTSLLRTPSSSTIHVDHDSAGMLTIKIPQNSCRTLRFGFLGVHSSDSPKESSKGGSSGAVRSQLIEMDKEPATDDESVKGTHSLLRALHKSIFAELVFDMVACGAVDQSVGVSVTGVQENFLQMSIGEGTAVFMSLVSSSGDDQAHKRSESPKDSMAGVVPGGGKFDTPVNKSGLPSRINYEIYLQQIFHEHVLQKEKDRSRHSTARLSGQSANNISGLLGHFCMSLEHRIFSNKVLLELENVVCRVPCLHLISHPTWYSRTSSWTIFMNFSPSQRRGNGSKKNDKSQFRTKVVVNDDCISVEGECAPTVVGSLRGRSSDAYSMNKYEIDLADLHVIVLQQVAGQLICWLHEEAFMAGRKAKRDSLSLSFELEKSETVSLVAHVDQEGTQGGITWSLVMEDGFTDGTKLGIGVSNGHVDPEGTQGSISWSFMDDGFTDEKKHPGDGGGASEYQKFLGYLSPESLYSILMDLVSLCSAVSN